MFAYKGGLHPWEPERALVVMPPVPRTEISPGAKLLVDAMTRTRSAHSEAATSPWVRAYSFVVIFTGHLLSGARIARRRHVVCPARRAYGRRGTCRKRLNRPVVDL